MPILLILGYVHWNNISKHLGYLYEAIDEAHITSSSFL